MSKINLLNNSWKTIIVSSSDDMWLLSPCHTGNFLDKLSWSSDLIKKFLESRNWKSSWQHNSLSTLSFKCDQYCRVDQESWSTFPIGILMSARATTLLIAWSSRLKLSERGIYFPYILIKFPYIPHSFPLPLLANKNRTGTWPIITTKNYITLDVSNWFKRY